MKQFFLTLTLLSFSFSASAGWPAIEGQLVDSLGEPILESNVDFKVEILDPGDSSCILSEEIFNAMDLTQSRGSFSLALGNSGNTPAFPGSTSSSYHDVFKVSAVGHNGSADCTVGAPLGAERDVRVSYSVSGGAYNSISSNLRYGGAASAATLNGIPASDFLKDNGSNTNQTNLNNIMGGLFPVPGDGTYALQLSGGVYSLVVASGSGTVTSITAGTGLAGGTITGAGTISIAPNGVGTTELVDDSVTADKLAHTAVAPGSYGSAGAIPVITVDQQGRLTSASSVAVSITETDPKMLTLGMAEVNQLENIDSVVISNTQWGYLGAMAAQPLESESDPGLQTLSAAEVDQLENIDTVTISNAQWGYLGGMASAPITSEVDTLASVTGRGASTADAITIDGSADAVQLTIQGHSIQSASPHILEIENAGGTVLASVRADGSVTSATDLATKSYVDSQVSGSGDVNNASNQGVGGVGAFITKNAGVLEFKNINAGSSKLSVTNDGANSEIDIDVVEANIDHDNLSGFVANEHIDHTGVSIATAAGTSGLSGGGNITATRNIAIDIAGTTDVASAQAADTLLIRDDDDSGNLKEISRANFLSGYLTSVSINDLSDAKITGVADVGPPSVPVNTSLGFGTEAMDMFTGPRSLAVGYEAMKVATTGTSNTALGFQSMVALTTGKNNTAVGALSLAGVTTGEFNTAVGDQALDGVTNGTHNIGIGYVAGTGITGGIKNIVIGHNSGLTIGTGDNNILIGDSVDVGSTNDSNKLNIGNTIFGDLANGRIGIGVSAPTTTVHIGGTEAIRVPAGTTAQRPASPGAGSIRFNSETNFFEGFQSGKWVSMAPGPMPGDEPTGAWNLIGTPGEASSFYIENAADNYATGAATLYTDAQVACAAKTSQTNRGIARVCSIDQLQRACLAGQIANGTFPSSNIVGAGLSTQIVVSAGGGSPGQCVVDGSTRNFTSGSQDFYCCMD